jgi:hypothetical protein
VDTQSCLFGGNVDTQSCLSVGSVFANRACLVWSGRLVQSLLVLWSWDRPLSYCDVRLRPPGPGIPIVCCLLPHRFTVPFVIGVDKKASGRVQKNARGAIYSRSKSAFSGEKISRAVQASKSKIENDLSSSRRIKIKTSPGGMDDFSVVPVSAKHNLRRSGDLSALQSKILIDRQITASFVFPDLNWTPRTSEILFRFELRSKGGQRRATWTFGFDISKGDLLDYPQEGITVQVKHVPNSNRFFRRCSSPFEFRRIG